MADNLESNRLKFSKVKRLSFFKRRKCKHDFVFIGGDGHMKYYGCLICGKEERF